MRILLAPLLLAVCLPAQELTQEQLRERFEKGEPLWEVQWNVDEDGELWMSPDPAANAEWGLVFPPKAGGLTGGAASLGTLGYVNMLVTGPRDLASLGDAEKLLTIAGRDTTPGALRKLIITPATGDNAALARRAALERILAVRLVQERGIAEARGELQAVARDADADPFLRRAAQDALQSLNGSTLPPSAVPAETLAAVPESVDVLFFIDQARVPPAFFLPRLASAIGTYVSYRELRLAGGTLSPALLAGSQMLAETASLLPFEIARSYGNARVDWTVGAARIAPRRVAFWVEAGGMFDYEPIARRLHAKGFSVEEEDGSLRVDDLPFSNALELSAHRVRVHGVELGSEPDPERAVALRKAGLGDAPVWVHVPAGSGLFADLPLPAAPKSATLTVAFDDGVTLTLRTEHDNKVHALGVASLLRGLKKQAERVLEDLEPSPVGEKVLGILRGAALRAEGTTFHATIKVQGVTPADAWSLVRRLLKP